jgi:hypothetical protein
MAQKNTFSPDCTHQPGLKVSLVWWLDYLADSFVRCRKKTTFSSGCTHQYGLKVSPGWWLHYLADTCQGLRPRLCAKSEPCLLSAKVRHKAKTRPWRSFRAAPSLPSAKVGNTWQIPSLPSIKPLDTRRKPWDGLLRSCLPSVTLWDTRESTWNFSVNSLHYTHNNS